MTYMGYQLSSALTAPFQIIIGIAMMYYFIGLSFVAGFGAMIFMILCSYITSKRTVKLNEQVLKVKD
jgi:ABC-type bacteriocin/lantibiotic exporter with double-glycine peptidase domain